jgi:hypothetical protein
MFPSLAVFDQVLDSTWDLGEIPILLRIQFVSAELSDRILKSLVERTVVQARWLL